MSEPEFTAVLLSDRYVVLREIPIVEPMAQVAIPLLVRSANPDPAIRPELQVDQARVLYDLIGTDAAGRLFYLRHDAAAQLAPRA